MTVDVNKENLPLHVAITMDGNGRWAQQRKLPRTSGHDEGLKTAKRIVKAIYIRCRKQNNDPS